MTIVNGKMYFTEYDEIEVITNKDVNEGQQCWLIRRWYEAADEAAISDLDETERCLDLKNT